MSKPSTTALTLDDYDYVLPKELIAQHPLPNRADARLLVVRRDAQSIEHFHIRDLPELLRAGDGLVLNDTRVLPAKLVGYRQQTKGRWLGLFLEADPDGHLKLLCKTRGQLKPWDQITLVDRAHRDDVTLTMLARLGGGAWAARAETDESPEALLERIGRVPLPHYIRGGNMVDEDVRRYQTVYASQLGSVAAPTAGLHFTQELLQQLQAAHIEFARVTLHVGLGTFAPIKVDRIEDHRMHQEWARLDEENAARLQAIRAAGGRVIGVGSTSVRTLESAALHAASQSGDEVFNPYQAWEGETDLFIRPPFQFRAIDGMLTNFHLPRTSLLVMVRTFGGDELIQRAYQAAIEERYRFFSYGDAMLIL